MNKYKKLTLNTVLFAISNFGSKFITILLVPYYTYILSTEQYGVIDLVTTTLSLILPIITLSITDAVLRFSIKSEYEPKYVFTNGCVIGILASLIVMCSIPVFKHIPILNGIELDFAILICVQYFYQMCNQFVRGVGHVKVFAFSGFLSTLSMLVLNIIFLSVFKMGMHGYFRALALSYCICILFVFFAAKMWRYCSSRNINKVLMKKMLIYSIPLIPNNIIWWVTDASDKYMIAFYLGAASNGIYAVAKKIPTLLSTLHSIFFQAWQLSAVEESESADKSIYFTNIFNILSAVMILGISFIIFVIKPVLKLLVSMDYYSAWKYIPFLLLAVAFSSFSGFLGTNYMAMKETKGIFKTTLVGAILNVVLNFALIPVLGMNGASLATCLSYVTTFFIRNYDTKRFVKIQYSVKYNIICTILILIQMVVLYSGLDMAYCSVLEGILFIITVLITVKNYKNELIRMINSIIKKRG